MSEGFGTTALLSALLVNAPPEIQRPQGRSVPVQRPKAKKTSTPDEPVRETTPDNPVREATPNGPVREATPNEPVGTPTPDKPAPESRPPLAESSVPSAADRRAEQEEFAELLDPLPPPAPPPAPVPATPPRAEVRAKRPPRFDPADISRQGLMLAVGVGASLCGHNWCDAYRGGFAGQVELGYRYIYVMPHLSVDAGGGNDDRSMLEEQLRIPNDTLSSARTSFLGFGAGLTGFFPRVGRFDPYATARLGYSRTRSKISDRAGNDIAETVSRASIRLGGGLDIYFGPRVAFGPRFDVAIPFAGRVCAEQLGAPETKECIAARDLEEDARVYAQELPVPVFVGAQIRVQFGGQSRDQSRSQSHRVNAPGW